MIQHTYILYFIGYFLDFFKIFVFLNPLYQAHIIIYEFIIKFDFIKKNVFDYLLYEIL
jgi:hypothetical protein